MFVLDGAYTVVPWKLKIAAGGGFISGDNNPYDTEKNKRYHGFIGLHESYNGKRVKSILILDERLLQLPVIQSGQATDSTDVTFSDLQMTEFGLTWAPKIFIKDFSINPNMINFWKAHRIHKYIMPSTSTGKGSVSTTEFARSYMGTEFNILTRCSVVQDLSMSINFAMFFPGGFFSDMKGAPLGTDFYKRITQDPRNQAADIAKLTLSNDTAYHVNVIMEYKF
jgi:hypothetical protein